MLHRSVLFSVVLLALITAVAWGEAVDHAWSLSFGSDIHDDAAAVAVDDFGNMYVTGYFQNTMLVGSDTLTSNGGLDIFLVKFAPDGSVVWSRSFGDALYQYAFDIACDEYGYTVITGRYHGAVDFGGGLLVSAGDTDIYVAKFSPQGNHIWSRSYGDFDEDVSAGVALDAVGNVFVVGWFSSSLTLGGVTLSSAGVEDIFLAKLDAAGTNVWAQQFGGTDRDQGQRVAVDNAGNVILAAEGRSAIDFGGGTLTPLGTDDVFLAKFDNNGSFHWAYNHSGTASGLVRGLETDLSDNVIIGVYGYSGSDYGGGPLPFYGNSDVIVAKYDQSGAHMWSQSFGGSGFDVAQGLHVEPSGDVIVTGYFTDTANFGGADLISHGGGDVFVVEYDATGAHLWSRSYGGSDYDEGRSAATDAFGNLVLFGNFKNTLAVGTDLHVSNGSDDALLIKYYLGPSINSALDVPGDQGGVVNLTWYGNSGDNAIDQAITEYSVWRAIDAGAAMAMVEAGAALVDDPAKVKSVARDQDVVRAAGEYFWFQVATVNAIGLGAYSAPVATLFDSTSTTFSYHYFQVIAHTTDPYAYYTSAPDSGYSVDNLAPATPQNLVAEQVAPEGLELTWDENAEADLSHYEVYRGTDPGFVADGGSLLGATSDATALDNGWSWNGGYWYKVLAVDENGNKSPHALIGPDLVSDAGGHTPAVNLLDQNVPNPFNPTTTIEFALAQAGDVTLRVYNATGQLVRTIVDEYRDAKTHAVNWDGRDDRGHAVASGVYFYRLEAGTFTQTRKMVLLK